MCAEVWNRLIRVILAVGFFLTTLNSAAQDVPATIWSVPADPAIREILAARVRGTGIGVVVGIVEPTHRRLVTYGESGISDGRSLDGDTIFQIGSVTKVFTTLLLADMVMRGEVGLDDKASGYLPSGRSLSGAAAAITLGDLATHYSGLPSMPTNFDLAAEPDPYEAYSADDLYAFLSSYLPSREPGTQYEYSNLGVALLGRLLARAAAEDYEKLLRERVLEPLGLASTAITLSPDQSDRLAPGHDRNLRPVHTWELKALPASGSLRSSANDLMTFLSAYLGYIDTPLRGAMAYQQEALRRPVPGGLQLLGWNERTFEGITVVGHDGGKEGYRSALVFDPKTRVGVVILSNARTDDTPIRLAVHLLTGLALPPPSVPPSLVRSTLNPDALESFAGRYELEGGSILIVARKRDHMLVDRPGDGITTIFPAGSAEFRSNISNDIYRFLAGKDGVVGLQWERGARSLSAAKAP